MKNPFNSFLMGGFECSTHRRGDKRRLDVIDASRHDKYAFGDYVRLREVGMLTARDGARWHLIEREPFIYDFSSVAPQIEAAQAANVQVIWDLFHYGYPDELDLMSEEFIKRFAAYARAFTEYLLEKGIEEPFLCLVNEISFFAWIAGEVGGWYPFLKFRGDDVKRQLVKATIAAAKEIRKIAPQAVLIQTDPVINVVPSRGNPENIIHARNFHNAQFHSLDMLLGLTEPEIGGSAEMVDLIGINYYSHNQWRHPSRRRLKRESRDYKPFSLILQEFYERYKKPFFVAETGIENEARPEWFRYICAEVFKALNAGIPVYGICLYPILNHPGWDDDRHCHNGLWDYADDAGQRIIYQPLADEITIQSRIFNEYEISEQPKYLTTHNS
jgi:hypothetical protein